MNETIDYVSTFCEQCCFKTDHYREDNVYVCSECQLEKSAEEVEDELWYDFIEAYSMNGEYI